MRTLADLASAAANSVFDLLDSETFRWFESLTDVAKIQWRYCHADCDEFAQTLAALTGWPILSVTHPNEGPLHRLVEAPDGRLLDVRGWTTPDALAARYTVDAVALQRGEFVFESFFSPIDDIGPVVDAILQLPDAPFPESGFQARILAVAAKIKKDLHLASRHSEVSVLEEYS